MFSNCREINNDDICPLLNFVIKNGNATVYQWKTGKVPTQIEEEVQKVDLEAMAEITAAADNAQEEEVGYNFVGTTCM